MQGVHPGLALDGLIGGLAISGMTAALLFPTAGASAAAQPGPPALFLLADLAILTFVVVTIGLTGWRPGTRWGLLCARIVLNTLGNVALVQATQAGTFERGSLVDTVYAASALSLGFAALYPIRGHERVRFDGSRTLLAPSAFALGALGLLVYGTFRGISVEAAVLGGATLVMLIVRTTMAFRENRGLLEVSRHEALTDGLTSLGNRRRLMLDLRQTRESLKAGRPSTHVLFDLDGFKGYNDSFGHPAGDALLARLAGRFAIAIGAERAYRAGGDEFCALLPCAHTEAAPQIAKAAAALSDVGDGFHVTASFGSVGLPQETADPAEALQVADGRMYPHKDGRRASASQQSRAVLMPVLNEREPGLRAHQDEVADLAAAVGHQLGLGDDEIRDIARAAEFHDIGKIAVPDAILHKPAPLDEEEFAFIRQHTVIGERILLAAPALASAAHLVRASHERWDGAGYPDGLAGTQIPLGARIILVCDAYSAMTSDRPHSAAIDNDAAIWELRRCCGTQFDPDVVEGCVAVLTSRRVAAGDGTLATVASLPVRTRVSGRGVAPEALPRTGHPAAGT